MNRALHSSMSRISPSNRTLPSKILLAVQLVLLTALESACSEISEDDALESESAAALQATAAAGEFRNSLNMGADPTMVFFNGEYYLSTTQFDRLSIWHSPSLATLITAPETVVWQDSDPTRNKEMWAPGLFRFQRPEGFRWYLYYTASDGVDDHHRLYVVESERDDPLGPYHFKAKIADFGVFAIDGEPFVHNGQMYFAWTSPGRGMGGPAQLYLAAMSNPWTLSSGRVALPADGGCPEVREGPTALRRGNRLFLTYSTCDTGKPDYQLWMKSIVDGADPLNPDSWVQHPGPIFSRNDAAGVWGPGHHFFFTSPDGSENWIAYHGKNVTAFDYHSRTTRAQQIDWNGDGTPNLGQPLAAGATQALPSGDPGPSPRWINDTNVGTGDFQVSYAGSWSSGSGCGNQCFWGDDHWSEVAGASATFRFTGTRIALFSVRDAGNGIAAMSIDGGPERSVDYYSSLREGEHLNYLSPILPLGQHTLRVRVTGQKNPSSIGTAISIDRAEIYRNDGSSLPNGTYRIRAEVGNHDLDVTDCRAQNGADVRIWRRITASPCQRWRVTSVGDNIFTIVDTNSGKALDVAGCSTADRAIVHLWPSNGADCQRWRIEARGGGAYSVIAVNSGKSLDVSGCSPAPGADVIIWPYHGGTCQRWFFDPL